jgi:hypothetical protein
MIESVGYIISTIIEGVIGIVMLVAIMIGVITYKGLGFIAPPWVRANRVARSEERMNKEKTKLYKKMRRKL